MGTELERGDSLPSSFEPVQALKAEGLRRTETLDVSSGVRIKPQLRLIHCFQFYPFLAFRVTCTFVKRALIQLYTVPCCIIIFNCKTVVLLPKCLNNF